MWLIYWKFFLVQYRLDASVRNWTQPAQTTTKMFSNLSMNVVDCSTMHICSIKWVSWNFHIKFPKFNSRKFRIYWRRIPKSTNALRIWRSSLSSSWKNGFQSTREKCQRNKSTQFCQTWLMRMEVTMSTTQIIYQLAVWNEWEHPQVYRIRS